MNEKSPFSPPEPTFAVRKPRTRAKASIQETSSSSPVLNRRIVRRESRSPTPESSPEGPVRKRKKTKGARFQENPLMDVEAIHSGEEVSAGESDVDMVESESDRQFLQGVPETQASPSYDQTQAYRAGLLTQVPAGFGGLNFANGPKRVGAHMGGRSIPRKPILLSSSPGRPNDYDMDDSFLAGDDESIEVDEEDTLSSD